jgi:SulP family sulfate permease
MSRLLGKFDQYDALILDLSHVPQMDFTSSRALEDMVHGARDSGRDALLVGCHEPVRKTLIDLGVMAKFDPDHILETRLDALETALRLIQARQS